MKKKKKVKTTDKKHRPYPASKLCNPEKHYERHEVWGTLDGQRIPIKNLRDSHIENIIHYFIGHGLDAPSIILQEKDRRKKEKLSKNSKTAQILYGSKR